MVGNEKVLPEKEIEFVGGEDAVLATVVDRMNNDEQIGHKLISVFGRVLFYLGARADSDAVFNRKRVKVENVFEHRFAFFGCCAFQIHPEKEVRVAQQRRHQDRFDVSAVKPALGGEYHRANHCPGFCARAEDSPARSWVATD
jgi:hypothetical protein